MDKSWGEFKAALRAAKSSSARPSSERRNTMSQEQQHDLVRLTDAVNPAEAHIKQQALEEAGICCLVLGDYLDVGIGDIGGLRPEIWGEASDWLRADEMLRKHHRHSDDAEGVHFAFDSQSS
jgi:hypothetical protein